MTIENRTERSRSFASLGGAPDVEDGPDEPRFHALLRRLDTPTTSYSTIILVTVLLVAFGLVMVLSSSSITNITQGRSAYAGFLNQARFAIIGAIVLIVAARIPPDFYRRISWLVLFASFAFQALVFTPLGTSVNGNLNWIRIGGQTFQPSEAIKLALAVWLGAVLATKRAKLNHPLHIAIPVVPVVGVALGLVLLGHDLGTAMVMMFLVVGALWVAGVPKRVFLVLGGALAALVAALVVASPNRIERITAFASPNCTSEERLCYQAAHGIFALASGGWWGLGLGASRQKWGLLPESSNDFIFAIIGEELGLLGTGFLLLLLGALILAMLRLVRRHESSFVQIATGAIMFWIIGQALVNIAVVVKLLPVIGVPLPLVSSGGSALVTTMCAMGVLLSFARTEPGARDALRARRGVVRHSVATLPAVQGLDRTAQRESKKVARATPQKTFPNSAPKSGRGSGPRGSSRPPGGRR